MKAAVAFACVLALAGCGKKKPDESPPPAGSDQPVATDMAKPHVTPAQVAAVGAQQSRLEELAALLDKADAVAAPVALLDAITKLPEWTVLVGKVDKLKMVGDVATGLKDGIAQLQTLKTGLAEAGKRLGNLKGELDKAMHDNAAKIDDLKKLISTQLRVALEPLAAQVATTIQKLGPMTTQLTDTGDMLIGACAIAKLSSSSKELTDICGKVKETFAQATTFLADLKAKPSTLYTEVSAKLEAQLGDLVDTGVKQALDAAQAQVDAALKLPPANGSGSGAKP